MKTRVVNKDVLDTTSGLLQLLLVEQTYTKSEMDGFPIKQPFFRTQSPLIKCK